MHKEEDCDDNQSAIPLEIAFLSDQPYYQEYNYEQDDKYEREEEG